MNGCPAFDPTIADFSTVKRPMKTGSRTPTGRQLPKGRHHR
jgi:hypothetical protein